MKSQCDENVEALKKLLPKSQVSEAPTWKNDSISCSTKDAKAELQKDPMNLRLILQLGSCYAEDLQWKQSFNVLCRGSGRLREISDRGNQVEFATRLAEAAMHSSQCQPALAALQEIEEPDPSDLDNTKRYMVMLCRVHCSRKEHGMAMKAFHRAIGICSFDEAVEILAQAQEDLRKLGGFDAAHAALQHRAETDADKSKLEDINSLRDLTLDGIRDIESQRERDRPRASRLMQRWKSFRVGLELLQADVRRGGLKAALRGLVSRNAELLDLQCMTTSAVALFSLWSFVVLLRMSWADQQHPEQQQH
eukprot:TRINITY_DN109024_c0_g1_i1.p1 TRINITY_DN109024_c0_g1~~TRINITY_DN109024_c0_g1_i1.p1  ORF type:complete len:307 (-),score=46.50 TRINITY_DN109024_c0_g1_i1:72-992(-)